MTIGDHLLLRYQSTPKEEGTETPHHTTSSTQLQSCSATVQIRQCWSGENNFFCYSISICTLLQTLSGLELGTTNMLTSTPPPPPFLPTRQTVWGTSLGCIQVPGWLRQSWLKLRPGKTEVMWLRRAGHWGRLWLLALYEVQPLLVDFVKSLRFRLPLSPWSSRYHQWQGLSLPVSSPVPISLGLGQSDTCHSHLQVGLLQVALCETGLQAASEISSYTKCSC